VPQGPPPWEFLAALPLYGTPIYVVGWAVHRFAAKDTAKALKGLAGGLAAWLACSILYLVVSFVVDPCLENCARLRTPAGQARTLALIVIYTALGLAIVLGLYRYGRRSSRK
jgi:hypothetical protein